MTDSETVGRALDEVATPFLYVDVDRMSSNLDAMAAAARRLGVRLRPHAKTHKVPEIARLQIAAGATGITVSKISEAEVFADAGIDDLFVAYQIVAPPQLERLVRLARSVRLRCAVDSREGAERLSRAATDGGIELGVMLEIDLGIGRTGVRAGVAAIELAQRISDLPSLELSGIYGFRGFRAYAEGTEARETWGRAEGRGPGLRRRRSALERPSDRRGQRRIHAHSAARRKRPGGDRDPTGSVPIRVRQRHSPGRHAGGRRCPLRPRHGDQPSGRRSRGH